MEHSFNEGGRTPHAFERRFDVEAPAVPVPVRSYGGVSTVRGILTPVRCRAPPALSFGVGVHAIELNADCAYLAARVGVEVAESDESSAAPTTVPTDPHGARVRLRVPGSRSVPADHDCRPQGRPVPILQWLWRVESIRCSPSRPVPASCPVLAKPISVHGCV